MMLSLPYQPPVNQKSIECYRCCFRKNATVISITNSAKSTLALKAKYHIQTISRERLFFPEFSFVFSRLAAMSVLETLFFLLAKSKINAQEYIDLHEQSMANDKN